MCTFLGGSSNFCSALPGAGCATMSCEPPGTNSGALLLSVFEELLVVPFVWAAGVRGAREGDAAGTAGVETGVVAGETAASEGVGGNQTHAHEGKETKSKGTKGPSHTHICWRGESSG